MKRGGFGDVREVWAAFSKHARWVAGVAGNHDDVSGVRSAGLLDLLRGDGIVHGELLCVHDAARLRALDAYEECGGPAPRFERVEGIARRADGVEVTAAAYLYVGPIGDGVVIAGGDYAVAARARRPTS